MNDTLPTPCGVIALITDFGTQDHYVGVVKGRILREFPKATLVDVSHEVPPYSIEAGRYLLGQSLPHFPSGTMHLVVVDPGVGTARDALVIATSEAFVLAPHNGLLDEVLDSGQVRGAWEIPEPDGPLSSTFHARDLFGPTAARVAAEGPGGLKTTAVPERFASPPHPLPTRGQVVWIDRFGNLVTNLMGESIPGDPHDLKGQVGGRTVDGYARCYEEASKGEPFFLVGSGGRLEISMNQASAARRLEASIGDEVSVFTQNRVTEDP